MPEHAGTDDAAGRRIRRTDHLSPRLLAQFRATLADGLAPGEVPPGLHWALCPDSLPPADLGRDGHPQPGLILPRLPLARRMWAGGEVMTMAAFRPGDEVTRDTVVEAVTYKTGRTGPLGFLAVRHDYSVGGTCVVSERQDFVYRHDPSPDDPRPAPVPAPDLGQPLATFEILPDPVLLFRYSALTFNGHRIHYDRDYATRVEGYDGLVVHGPMQATWMLNLVTRVLGACPSRFTYRGVSAPIVGAALVVEAHSGPEASLALRVRREDGSLTMTGAAWA